MRQTIRSGIHRKTIESVRSNNERISYNQFHLLILDKDLDLDHDLDHDLFEDQDKDLDKALGQDKDKDLAKDKVQELDQDFESGIIFAFKIAFIFFLP